MEANTTKKQHGDNGKTTVFPLSECCAIVDRTLHFCWCFTRKQNLMSSRFEPHLKSIEEMFKLGYSYRKIARTLADQHGLADDPAGLFRWWKNNVAKRTERAAMLTQVQVVNHPVIQEQIKRPPPQSPPQSPPQETNPTLEIDSQSTSSTLKPRIPKPIKFQDKTVTLDDEGEFSPEDIINAKRKKLF